MKIRSVWLTKLAVRVGVTALRLLFATCPKRFVISPGTNAYDPDLAERFLYCVWHDVLLFPMLMGQAHHMSGLTSKHQDGSFLAEAFRLLKIAPFRGSTSRGGAQAVRQLLEAADKLHITITPDGPRGPRRQMKEGIVFLASRTGKGIVPMAFGCRRGFRIRGTWTDMLIPFPFTTTFVIADEPIRLSKELTREELDAAVQQVQSTMDRLYARLDDLVAGRTSAAVAENSAPIPQRNAA